MRKSQGELKIFCMSENEQFMLFEKALLTWKFIALNTYIRKKGRIQIDAKLPPEESVKER